MGLARAGLAKLAVLGSAQLSRRRLEKGPGLAVGGRGGCEKAKAPSQRGNSLFGAGLCIHLLSTHYMRVQAAWGLCSCCSSFQNHLPCHSTGPCSFCSEDTTSTKPSRFSGPGQAPPFALPQHPSSSHHRADDSALQLGCGHVT